MVQCRLKPTGVDAMPPLRIDPTTSEFLQLRQDHLLYVDKTSQVASFLSEFRYQLYARPRRFGKSLLLSTIETMYSGNRELFAGNEIRPELSVYREGTWHWRPHEVVRMDMSEVGESTADMAGALNDLVNTTAEKLNLVGIYRPAPERPSRSLINLVVALSRRSEAAGLPATVVILVDEYDAPFLNRMHRPQEDKARPVLADFYGAFKSLGPFIEKLVMTGVTRFVKTGLWSKLNQVQDQSANHHFHDLTGFTDEELDILWERIGHRASVVSPLDHWPPLSREAWCEWYNGYRFSSRACHPIYNPFAIMSSLHDGEMGEYWSETGHLGVVEALLQAPWVQAEPLERVPLYLTRPDVVDRYELSLEWLDSLEPGPSPEAVLHQWDSTRLVPLLYQTGYLTLTPEGDLAPPNREVASYLSRVLLEPWLKPDDRKQAVLYQAAMVDALLDLDLPAMVAQCNRLLQLLPHQRFHGALRSATNLVLDLAVLFSRNRIRYHEMEKSGIGGDSDTILQWDDVSLAVEIKTGETTSAWAGQRQIERKGYLQALPTASRLYLGLALYATDGRLVSAWICQGYAPSGEPLGEPLTEKDSWPTGKGDLYQRWAIDRERGR